MIEQQIKKLIQKNFDLELLSFEFDIPIEKIIQWKKELEITNNNKKVNMLTKEDKDSYLKINEIRKRYQKLYNTNYKDIPEGQKELTEEENILIELVTLNITEKLKEMENCSREEKRKLTGEICSEYAKIEKFNLELEQTKTLGALLNSEELDMVKLRAVDKINEDLIITRKNIANKFANAINVKCYEFDDVKELKKLEEELKSEIFENDLMTVEILRNKIEAKILRIQEKNRLERVKTNISEDIESLITDLSNGKLDIVNANEIIGIEAKKRVESKPKNRFSLTEEKEKKQILIQMRMAIVEKADKYYVKNPEQTIFLLQKLDEEGTEQAIITVVKNLIANKNFELAKNICDKFSCKDREKQQFSYIKSLRNEIRNAEIGDMVLKGLNMNGTIAEEKQYFDLIEKGLKRDNIKLEAISLGKNSDGMRTITLKDIWEDENKKNKSR